MLPVANDDDDVRVEAPEIEARHHKTGHGKVDVILGGLAFFAIVHIRVHRHQARRDDGKAGRRKSMAESEAVWTVCPSISPQAKPTMAEQPISAFSQRMATRLNRLNSPIDGSIRARSP